MSETFHPNTKPKPKSPPEQNSLAFGLPSNGVSTIETRPTRKRRLAVGIGATTLITILVVMLLATFSVLSLVSARSDLHLSQMAADASKNYYFADNQATQWYAQLDSLCSNQGDMTTIERHSALKQASYDDSYTEAEQIIVNKTFAAGNTRMLEVSIIVAKDGTTSIRQWQIVSITQ